MLTTSLHPNSIKEMPKLETSGPYQWVTWGGLTIHLYNSDYTLEQFIELHSILGQFIQESLHAQSPLPNGDRLDNSRDVSILPAESLPPVYATLETHE